MSILLYLGIFLFIMISIILTQWVKLKIPSNQVLTFFDPLMKAEDLSLESKLSNSVKDIEAERKQLIEDEMYKINLQRYRLPVDKKEIKQMKRHGSNMSGLAVILAMMLCAFIHFMALSWALMIPVIAVAVLVILKLNKTHTNVVKYRKKWIETDMVEDLYNFLSEYRYSDPTINVFNYIQSIIPNSNSMIVDFKMLISDLNTFSEAVALDALAKRVPNDLILRFVSILKLTLTGGISNDQFKISVDSLAGVAKEKVIATQDKERNTNFLVVLTCIVLVLAAVCLIFLIEPIVDTHLSLMANS